MAEAKKVAKATTTKTKKAVAEEVVAVTAEAVVAPIVEEKVAKAGKRSLKAVKEAEAVVAKEERKLKAEVNAEAPAHHQKPTRSILERRGKNYRKANELVEKKKVYELKEALDLAIKTSLVKFDASVEMHINLAVDPRQADQNIRGSIALPAGTGKTVRIVVLADAKDADAAIKAGADKAGSDDIFAALDKGIIDFDILICTPAMMPKLGKYARVLGPKGLMPNPKSGTVTPDVAKAVSEAKAGKVEFRVDSTGIVHLAVGKVSFGVEKLEQNASAVLATIRSAKPLSLKGGTFIKSVHLTTTMGPSIKISFN